jgi:hypothetical protein
VGPFFFNRQTVFFQSLGEKNKKQKFVTWNPGDTMGVSGYGSFFCLWAARARSARGRVFKTTGYLLEKNCHPGRRQPRGLYHRL